MVILHSDMGYLVILVVRPFIPALICVGSSFNAAAPSSSAPLAVAAKVEFESRS